MASDFSLQPKQRGLLFGSTSLPVWCWLEYLSCGMRLKRFSERLVIQEPALNQNTPPALPGQISRDGGQVSTSQRISCLRLSAEERRTFSGKCWEEIFLIRGELDYNRNVCTNTYLCLSPQVLAPACCAGASGAVILRVISDEEPNHETASEVIACGKPASEVVDFTRLTWNEIPSRRANDPGARIVELAANATRTRITSLMDCRAGWVLDDHDHPSDVLTFCVRGGGLLGIEDQSSPYRGGDLVALPAGIRHRFETGPEGAFLLIFVFEPFLSGGALRFGVPLESYS